MFDDTTQEVDVPAAIPEVDDISISNEQLGAVVRAFRGMTRPPQVIVVRPSWFEKAVVVLGFLLIGVIVAGAWINYQSTLSNRKIGKDLTHVLCDPGRIPEIVHADERTKQICEANQ